jgi:HKD family nuclease
MGYKLINNLSGTANHLTRVKELFDQSDTVTLISPFLMVDFADFFGEINLSSLKKLHLITTLSPKSFDQIKKVSSLVSLIEFPAIKEKTVECQISLNNKLHGKIYIFKKNNVYTSAIISSANFTASGLSRNHEWGIEISNSDEISALEKTILNCIEFSNLTFDEIHKMQKATNDFLDQQPQTEIRDIDLDLTKLISSVNWASQLDSTINYWLKPIGVTAEPVEPGRLFNTSEYPLHFSKQRPTGVKPNDILIAHGVGVGKILSIYRATSFPIRVTDQSEEWYERWPWYITGNNLTPNFGGKWWTFDLYTTNLKEEFLDSNKEGNITAVGGKTLGALNHGKDKLNLAPEFAKFIIQKVTTLENNLINKGQPV